MAFTETMVFTKNCDVVHRRPLIVRLGASIDTDDTVTK
jgi:hypothetical protein